MCQQDLLTLQTGKPRRKADRANYLDSSRDCYVECSDLGPAELRILNISEWGAGIELRPGSTIPREEQRLNLSLLFGYLMVKVQARVAHIRTGMAGLEFLTPGERIRTLIKAYFQAELLGASMKPALGVQGANHVRFENNAGNWLEIVTQGSHVIGFTGEFPDFALQFKWTLDDGNLCLQGSGSTHATNMIQRRRLTQVIRNLTPLSANIKLAIENIINP